MTSADLHAIVVKLRAAGAARPKTHCKKCGKETVEARMHPEAAADMSAAGYDGTCCWVGFDEMAAKDDQAGG